jgi:hypothetical protein
VVKLNLNYFDTIKISIKNYRNDIRSFLIKSKIPYVIQLFLCIMQGYILLSYLSFFDSSLNQRIFLTIFLINIFCLCIFICSKYISTLWRRFTLYFTLFIFTITNSNYIISYFGSNETCAESARDILSTLIGSEVNILAIIVSISLVVIQQAATYSPNSINIFKNIKTNPDFYILFTAYIFAILYEVWLLKQIKEIDADILIKNLQRSSTLSPEFESHIQFTY